MNCKPLCREPAGGLAKGIPDKSFSGKTKTTNNNKKGKKVWTKEPLKPGQVVMLDLPEYNQYGQKQTSKKPCWVCNVTDDSCVLVPLSTRDKYRYPYQKPYDTGSGKLSWLQLDSVTMYSMDNEGYLKGYWYLTVTKLSQEMCLQMLQELKTFSYYNPQRWMKDKRVK